MNQHAHSIIHLLEHVRKYPNMYTPEDTQSIVAFIHGIRFACAAFDVRQNEAIYKEMVQQRGWTYGPEGCWNQMIRQGKDYPFIHNELLTIEMETWKKTFGIILGLTQLAHCALSCSDECTQSD